MIPVYDVNGTAVISTSELDSLDKTLVSNDFMTEVNKCVYTQSNPCKAVYIINETEGKTYKVTLKSGQLVATEIGG